MSASNTTHFSRQDADPLPEIRRRSGRLRRWFAYLQFAVAALAAAALSVAHAQDIEPRAYSNAPVGVNFLLAGYAYTQGDLPFGASLPIKNAHLSTSSGLLAYARVIDLGGMSGKFDAIVPASTLAGTAEVHGVPTERNVNGLADSRFRLSVNFVGSPALTLEEFRDFEQDLIVGASLQVSVPVGQYDNSRMINIGTNRWSFKPELGISKTLGPWTMEFQAAATFFTDNKDFYGGNTRSQDPIYSLQTHVIYGFHSGIWGSLDATYFTGGRTTLNDELANDLQQNWRVGGTLAFPVDVRNSIKLYGSSGVSARTGNNYDLIGILWQYRWGAGL
jgi:Putative MetA-pathway of phenol degradation